MLIGIEASRANKMNKTGVEWYAWHVIQEMKRLTREDGNSWILYTNEMLKGGLEALPQNWFEVRTQWPLPYGWTQFRLSWEMYRRPVDVLFLPGSTLPRYMPKRTVVTVHDVGFHRFPQLYKKRQIRIHEVAMKEIRKRAARIITVSEFSKREIMDAYGIEAERIFVTPNGVDHHLYRPIADAAEIESRLQRYRLSKPFFLVIGRLETKKNIVNLIRAFSHFKTYRGVGDPHTLVLAGMPGHGYEEIQREIAESPARASIHELGYVPEIDLPYLLNAARALIHPSWYEGFGIPPIMAMACGCPVIASNAASLPEVVGEAGILVAPDDIDAMARAMTQVADDPAEQNRLRDLGIRRAAQYTWENTARQTIPILTKW